MRAPNGQLCHLHQRQLGEVEARARARLREGAFRDADLCASVTSPLPQSRLNASPATSPKQSLGEVTRLTLRH